MTLFPPLDEEEEEEESDSDNDVEPRAGQSTSLVDEIDRLCAELSDEVRSCDNGADAVWPSSP